MVLGEEALIEVASKMKTIHELEPNVKDIETRLTIMEDIKSDMETAVGTLENAVNIKGMGARYQRADRLKKSFDSAETKLENSGYRW